MSNTIRVVVAVAFFLGTGLSANDASARKVIAQDGAALSTGDTCFRWDWGNNNQGIAYDCPAGTSSFWIVPLQLDSSGTKIVTIRGKQSGAQQLGCAIFEVDQNGTNVEQVLFPAFTPAIGYQSRLATISIASGNGAYVMCSFLGDATGARLLFVDHTP